ncbi:hypothetical protein MMC25_000815 [Agyrium rufum]|nr:hypothetical protein [Agyrium rufum]
MAPASIVTASIIVKPRARQSYIALSYIARSFSRSTRSPNSQFHRSDFANQPFEGSYEAGEPTAGPLGSTSSIGAPRITPRVLKDHLDQFVVGQDRAKKTLSVAVYNHYQRVQELVRRDFEEEQLFQQRQRQERQQKNDIHPVEDEFPGHSESITYQPTPPQPLAAIGTPPIIDTSSLSFEKSNILLLGPSGVGKTLMAKTLARVLAVPFSMSDCTPFTQAGYIGEDVQVCVERLLAAANYDVAAAENGVICLDEIDKIASVKLAHGRDVGGEGVQQALLKIIEGTTLQIQSKQDRSGGGGGGGQNRAPPNVDYSNSTGSPIYGGRYAPSSPNSSASSGSSNPSGPSPSSKSETYNVRTDNILFIFTGAFNGLSKMILNRLAKGSIGFGSPIRSSSANAQNSDSALFSALPGSEESKMFEKHLPFFVPPSSSPDKPVSYNPLDLLEPTDLQSYGMIPELVGRIPVSSALSALDEEALVRVLTEPRNSLVKQYEQLFQLSGIELKFTSGALREVAKSTLNMATGARGLRTVVERLLAEAMFEAPGSSIRHILVTEAVAQRKQPPIYWSRGAQSGFHSAIAEDEKEWEARKRRERGEEGDDGSETSSSSASNFAEYREKSKAAGAM